MRRPRVDVTIGTLQVPAESLVDAVRATAEFRRELGARLAGLDLSGDPVSRSIETVAVESTTNRTGMVDAVVRTIEGTASAQGGATGRRRPA